MIVLFALDVVLVLAFGYFLAATFHPRARPAFFVAWFVLVWADLVLAAEVLSLFSLIVPWAWLAAHAVLAGCAFVAWREAGRPSHPKPLWPDLPAARPSLRSDPDLWTLVAIAAAGYALLAVVNILVPPNNLDSMAYHLTRVAYWMQHHNLVPWTSDSLTQTGFPLNAEIGSLESMLFLRNDILAGFTQWFAALAAAASVFGMARGFGSSRRQSAFASVVYLTLPMIVLQATTTQNDLTTAALIAAAVYFFLSGLRSKRPGLLVLSGLAVGLALGTKLTAPMLIPGWAAAVIFLALFRKPRPIRLLSFWAAACAAGFLVLGAFNYVQSWIHFREPLVGVKLVNRQLNQNPIGNLTLVRSNLARDVFSFADPTGLPGPAARRLVLARADLGRAAFRVLRVPPDAPALDAERKRFDFSKPDGTATEAGAFFGPLGFILILPLALYWSVSGVVRRDDRLIPALTFLAFMLVLAGSQAWLPFRGRLYCGAVTLVAPLIAGLYGRSAGPVIGRMLVAIVAALTLVVTILTNVQKPLVGPEAIWSKSREERRALIVEKTFPVGAVAKYIPEGVELATISRYTDPEYLLFGERLSRKLIPVQPRPAAVDLKWLRDNPYDYVFVHEFNFVPVAPLPADEFTVLTHRPYTLIIRKKPGR